MATTINEYTQGTLTVNTQSVRHYIDELEGVIKGFRTTRDLIVNTLLYSENNGEDYLADPESGDVIWWDSNCAAWKQYVSACDQTMVAALKVVEQYPALLRQVMDEYDRLAEALVNPEGEPGVRDGAHGLL